MINFKTDTMKVGEAWRTIWDLTSQTTATSSTVASASWAICSGTLITLSGESTTTTKTEALITAVSTGTTLVNVTVTFSNDEIGLYQIQIKTVAVC